MSDTKWLIKQGFKITQSTKSGFSLITMKLKKDAKDPTFNKTAVTGKCPHKKGITVYYSNRCPFSEYHVKESLVKTAKKRKLPLKIIKIDSMKKAQSAPTPATIFSLFMNGEFITTDISVCMDKRFDKLINLI